MSRTRAALCTALERVRVVLVFVPWFVAAWCWGMWHALRWNPTEWKRDIERLVEEAQRAGLCSHLDLEQLRTEREPLSAKVCEHAPSPTRMGLAFVPESRAWRATSSLLTPQLVGGERMMTLLFAVPRPIYDAVLARPADERLEAMVVMEANRLRFHYKVRGQDVPPDAARFYACLREGLQRRRDVETPRRPTMTSKA